MIFSRTLYTVRLLLVCINFATCNNLNGICTYLNVNFGSVPLVNQTNYHFCKSTETLSDNSTSCRFNNCKTRIYQSDVVKNVTEKLNDTEQEQILHPSLKLLTNYLFDSIPPFDLSYTEEINKKCRVHSLKYIRGLHELKMWALKMYDSNAKIPSGILSGNVNQLGDFDECLSARSEDSQVKGQYCLAYLQIQSHRDPHVNSIHKLIHSHFPFKSNLDDPGHRVPRFSSINWALCVPDSCTSKDVEIGFKKSVNRIFNGTGLNVQIQVDPNMCQTLESKPLPFSTVLAMWFFTAVIFIALTSTIYDCYKIENKNDLMVAFSLKMNFAKLTSSIRAPNDIHAIHGVRFINAFILLFAHKSMALFFIPYMNRTEMSEFIGKPWTVLGRAASLYTDPFIMIGGTLTAYSFYAKLQRTNKINIIEEYISRMFRIIPSLAALIMFCTYVLPWLSSGPQWNLVVTHHSDICKKYWWRNLLFIHNYFGFKDMCLTHTHHVGIDTQLFLISPLLVLLLWKWPKRGIIVLTIWATASTIMRYYVTYTKQLSNYIHYGTSIEQLFNTADNMYILPSHRITVYIMGILLGCSLQHYRKVQLSSVFIGNTIALISFCLSFFGPSFMGDINYVYRPVDAAWYAAFSPIFWCLSFVWIIFLTHNGYSNRVTKFFTWKGFLIWTRISYAVYLTQFPIFFFNVGTTRTSDYYSFLPKNFNMAESLWVCFLSVLLTVLIELPFQNIRSIMLKKKSKIT